MELEAPGERRGARTAGARRTRRGAVLLALAAAGALLGAPPVGGHAAGIKTAATMNAAGNDAGGVTGNGALTEEEAITAVYTALIGRPSTETETGFWARRIRDRGGRLELSWLLLQDTSRHVTRLYRDALGREPLPEELRYWNGYGPMRLRETAALILGSEEARARFGDTDAYIAALYRNILGRGIDPGGLAYWTGSIASGAGTVEIAEALWSSPEARGRRIRDAYRRVLGREADTGGYLYWLSSGYDEPGISAVLATGDELWRPTIPGELPFTFPGSTGHSTIHTERSVTFVVWFTARPGPERFCEIVENAVRAGGAQIETSCTPAAPFLVGTYRGETLLLAASGRDSFTLTIGTPYG